MFEHNQDYLYELATACRREKANAKRTDPITTDAGWNNNNYGSAECYNVTMDAIMDAYNEYKSFDW